MNKQDLIMTLNVEKNHAERQVMQEIESLQRGLSDLKKRVEDGSATADDSLQGNDWRLQKELTNYVRLKEFIERSESVE